jgi:hypothetical protein
VLNTKNIPVKNWKEMRSTHYLDSEVIKEHFPAVEEMIPHTASTSHSSDEIEKENKNLTGEYLSQQAK